MVRASIEAEKVGIRSTTIVASAFAPQARAVARSLGFSNLALAEYPGVIMLDKEDELRTMVGETVVDQIVKGFAGSLEMMAIEREPEPRDTVFTGTLDEVQEYFYRKQWSDGLPFIPPTIRRVEQFLQFTDRSPDEVIGRLSPEKREATVWNVAVNGLMAGCRPEYMPILLAIVEAISEPIWRIEDGGSTPGWEPLVIVNGPIVKDLDFNYETGAMRVGRQANTSTGRFLRLYMRNIAGLRIAGSNTGKEATSYTDKGSIAGTFNVALAENEDAVAEVGWRTFAEERGFAREENVVTVQSVMAISPAIYVAGDDIDELMQPIVDVWGGGAEAYWCFSAMFWGSWYPLLVMSPSIAKVLAAKGWTKDDVKQYLFEKVKVPAGKAEQYMWKAGGGRMNLCEMVEEGKLPKEYCTSSDPSRLVPVFFRPDWTGIVVAGDPGRNQARGYTQNHFQGPPVSKAIKLPTRWKELLGRSES